MDIEFSLALPREAIGIPMVRRALGDSLRSLGVTESCVSDILLAVTEACANAVRHGGPANRYEVEAAIGYGRCDVRIIDRGHGLLRVPEHYPPADTENGRGILIMQAVVDEISFDITPGRGTTVHLRKHLDWDEDAAFLRRRMLAAV
ncbi:anti-sigma F factor [Streptosporangium roseum]|uniref:Anti-sigma regulatory factor, serine/threonine protein kinase n=1 Tax=Streptosporangium roseum (strain ATCC 12428 / DSM 43021 / JCM 3005 / KCTC 9067 / NCIMB 10171 / NRRL 2505 / NI 9100) TaxID=479432 RepID=D2B962_STRRD|nr:putative anti-sigma regulatory factor, serine/threonine protein kinase [Streptosporangium roseum DSM 43021]